MVGLGVVGGESVEGGWGWVSAVWLLDSESGRAAVCWWDDEAKAGEAGGVCVEARGRVPVRESSREASAWLPECRCRFRRKLIPLWTPVGRCEGELGTAVATVGRAGVVVVVNITPVSGAERGLRPEAGVGGNVNARVSTAFDRRRSLPVYKSTHGWESPRHCGTGANDECKCTLAMVREQGQGGLDGPSKPEEEQAASRLAMRDYQEDGPLACTGNRVPEST